MRKSVAAAAAEVATKGRLVFCLRPGPVALALLSRHQVAIAFTCVASFIRHVLSIRGRSSSQASRCAAPQGVHLQSSPPDLTNRAHRASSWPTVLPVVEMVVESPGQAVKYSSITSVLAISLAEEGAETHAVASIAVWPSLHFTFCSTNLLILSSWVFPVDAKYLMCDFCGQYLSYFTSESVPYYIMHVSISFKLLASKVSHLFSRIRGLGDFYSRSDRQRPRGSWKSYCRLFERSLAKVTVPSVVAGTMGKSEPVETFRRIITCVLVPSSKSAL